MKRTSIYLSEKQMEKLKSLSHAEDMSVSDIIRRAVDVYLLEFAKRERKLIQGEMK